MPDEIHETECPKCGESAPITICKFCRMECYDVCAEDCADNLLSQADLSRDEE